MEPTGCRRLNKVYTKYMNVSQKFPLEITFGIQFPVVELPFARFTYTSITLCHSPHHEFSRFSHTRVAAPNLMCVCVCVCFRYFFWVCVALRIVVSKLVIKDAERCVKFSKHDFCLSVEDCLRLFVENVVYDSL